MSALKVLFVSRSNLTTVPAGDMVQVLNTKRALEALGIQVDLVVRTEPKVQGHTLIHLFNTIPIHEIMPVYNWAKQTGLPLVLSPIYWDAAGWVAESADAQGQEWRLNWWRETQELRKQVIAGADLLLPNAQAEAEKIRADFGLSSLSYKVVPNAADKLYACGNPQAFRRRFKIRGDFVFCSARIDPRKNQLALIEALADTDFQLVFAGNGSDAGYFRRFQAKLGPKIHHLGLLQPRDLANAYAAAKVHALVSWYDTPGLASLEAALAGCQIVTTERGSAREYFGSQAFYCQPNDLGSIRRAVVSAYQAPRSPGLRRLIAEKYTWEQVGRVTKQAYLELLS